jgi:hypothetical protein
MRVYVHGCTGDVLMLILFEWSRKLCGCMRWYLENKLKGDDLIWSKRKKEKHPHNGKSNLTKERVNLPMPLRRFMIKKT